VKRLSYIEEARSLKVNIAVIISYETLPFNYKFFPHDVINEVINFYSMNHTRHRITFRGKSTDSFNVRAGGTVYT